MTTIYARSLNVDKIIAVVGPTGSGKSELAVQLAKRFNGEIISCDSMQVYKKMDIGTAKITKEQMQGIPHYLIDQQGIEEPYNVSIFQEKCRQAIQTIQEKGKLPILCGGTGLYLKAALYDYTFQQEEGDPAYEARLEAMDNEALVSLLEQKDPQALGSIHPNNRKRLIRALMMAHVGKTKTQREQEQQHQPLYDVLFLGMDIERAVLVQRIDARVERMFEQGLEKEVETLFSQPETWEYNSFQGIGYKEFLPYLKGECDLESVKEAIQIHSRQYAKRQMTWFKHQMDVQWIQNEDQAIQTVEEFMHGNL